MSPIDHLKSVLAPDEPIVAEAILPDAHLAVTDRRIAVVTDQRVALNLPLDQLRRIQFDIERDRPATAVIVPDKTEPQVLVVPPESLDAMAKALTIIGLRLSSS